MSVSTVANTIATYVASVTGFSAQQVRKGMPNEHKAAGFGGDVYPYCVYTLPLRFQWERLTFGGSVAQGFNKYDALLTFYLGNVEMTQEAAIAVAQDLVDRLRLQFCADPTLGGVCFESLLSDPNDNLASSGSSIPAYRELGQSPILQWRLSVIETRTASQAAS